MLVKLNDKQIKSLLRKSVAVAMPQVIGSICVSVMKVLAFGPFVVPLIEGVGKLCWDLTLV